MFEFAKSLPHPSVELVEYISGVLGSNSRSKLERSARGEPGFALSGGELLVNCDRAPYLNLSEELRRLLAFFQAKDLDQADQIGIYPFSKLGPADMDIGSSDLLIGIPESILDMRQKGRAVLLTAARSALFHATLIAAAEGLDTVPAALYLLVLSWCSQDLNRLPRRALLIHDGLRYQTTSLYTDFQDRLCDLSSDHYLVRETPLSDRYPGTELQIVEALYDSGDPNAIGRAHQSSARLEPILSKLRVLPGSWKPGQWNPVLLTNNREEVDRLVPLLLERGMLYHRYSPHRPGSSDPHLSVRSEDIKTIWSNLELRGVHL